MDNPGRALQGSNHFSWPESCSINCNAFRFKVVFFLNVGIFKHTKAERIEQ